MVAGCTGLGRALRVANSECCQNGKPGGVNGELKRENGKLKTEM